MSSVSTTTMHSSTMHTVHCSGHLRRGGICPEVCAQDRVCASGLRVSRGCLPREGVSRGCIPACNGADIPRWTEFLIHACENITFPQLLLRTATTTLCMRQHWVHVVTQSSAVACLAPSEFTVRQSVTSVMHEVGGQSGVSMISTLDQRGWP